MINISVHRCSITIIIVVYIQLVLLSDVFLAMPNKEDCESQQIKNLFTFFVYSDKQQKNTC